MSTSAALLASRKRAAHPDFVPTFSLAALGSRLPLPFPVAPGLPPSPKVRYRSYYRYLGYQDLTDAAQLIRLEPFEIALRLVDFSPLRAELAQVYVASARGQVPFDPVSLLLCVCLRRELHIGWRRLARLLAGEHGIGWRHQFGFQDGVTPSASGMRYFYNTVGPQRCEELVSQAIDLLHQAGLLPERSTLPGDPADRGVSITHDIMLHPAHSNMACAYVSATCYQPLASASQTPLGDGQSLTPRPCPARSAGREGCACDTPACAQVCRLATPADCEARFIHYQGCNKEADLPNHPTDHGRDVYGYASNPDRLLDDRFACAWTLRTGLYPANADERNLFPDSFAALQARFPWLKIGEVLADAALGFQPCLDPIWQAGALRMVDIRAAEGDDKPEIQLRRGYDAEGHPLCPHGYPLRANGHDYERRRTKWCCAQACERDQKRPAPDCPYRDSQHPLGQIVNVGHTLPDGSVRLAREVPYGSDAWKARYGRRNLSESRNGAVEGCGLKRFCTSGLAHDRQEIAIADFLDNLRTLARLVQEATLLAAKRPPAP
jgi:hypothetical protein